MHDEKLSKRIEAAKQAVMAQTVLFHREFGRTSSNWKHDGTRVTPVDIAISEGIVAELSAWFPDDDFFSEELTVTEEPVPATKRFAWVLDPIDGTNNYATGIPCCAISLALLEHGAPVYGVIYDLSRGVLLHGGPGFGAFEGERRITVKSDGLHPQSMIGFHSPVDKKYSPHASVLVENVKIRALGSSTLHLAYVAAGLLDGTVDHNVKIWDIAAAIPLCLAAGGEVHFISAQPLPLRTFDLKMKSIFYLAGNAAVCSRLRELLGAPAVQT